MKGEKLSHEELMKENATETRDTLDRLAAAEERGEKATGGRDFLHVVFSACIFEALTALMAIRPSAVKLWANNDRSQWYARLSMRPDFDLPPGKLNDVSMFATHILGGLAKDASSPRRTFTLFSSPEAVALKNNDDLPELKAGDL
jgi:hypothetical protein